MTAVEARSVVGIVSPGIEFFFDVLCPYSWIGYEVSARFNPTRFAFLFGITQTTRGGEVETDSRFEARSTIGSVCKDPSDWGRTKLQGRAR